MTRSLPGSLLFLIAACASSDPASSSAPAPATAKPGDPFDVPLDGVTHAETLAFHEGDALFGLPLREYDGLGPLYTRTSCGGCHTEGVRGPGFVQKMAVVAEDGVTPVPDSGKLPFGNTVHPLVTAGATTPIVPPTGDASIKVSTRIGPPVLGRGYMEAILDSEILRVQTEQSARTDGIHGRINYVHYASLPNPDTSFHQHQPGDVVVGRFGLKARIATLDDFTADAMQGDMGITSPLRPTEFDNPDHLTDDLKPGVDVTVDSVNKRANYMRFIAIPFRASIPGGSELFERAQCAACHVPSMKTSSSYPIALLASADAPVFTDMLLHDMGDALADGLEGPDGDARSRDWRTAPLIGLRFNRTFLHDGRAHSIGEAIVAHDGPGSEASASVHLFQAFTEGEQRTLLEFVSAL